MIAHVIPVGDLELVAGTTRVIKDGEYARQRVEVSLDFFLGEWFLNKLEGVSYFRDVLIKNPNSDTVRSVFRQRILETPGIVAVPVLDVVLDLSSRKALVDFEAIYEDGSSKQQGISVTL
jgi:hypothetical protein